MMSNEADAFAKTLRATMSLYNREISQEAARIWWGALKEYSLAEVGEALANFIKSPKGHFAPLPADVIELCRKSSGHLSPDEAWALALTSQDERESIIWTTQISEAMGAAQPCLDNRDKYGARLAFLSAYERLTASSDPKWTVSLGDSLEGRERAVDAALKRGLIAPDHAQRLLPFSCDKVVSVAGLLPAPEKTPEEKAAVAEVFSKLREIVK